MKYSDHKMIRKLYKVLETLALINTMQDVDRLLEVILRASRHVMGAEASSLMLLDVEKNELYFNTVEGGSVSLKETRIPITKGIAGHVAATGRGVVINDVKKSKFFFKAIDEMTHFSTKSMICIPLKNRQKTIGVLQVLNKKSGKFTLSDKKLFTAYGDQVAVAVDNARLYNMAFYDSLTHVFVRRYFEAWLDQEFARVKRYRTNLSLIIIDIDHFKHVNDSYGHQAGDYVLEHMTKILRQNVRRSDIIARYGGEEFVICLPETKLQRAKYSAERLRAAVEGTVFDYNGQKMRITISLGLASFRNSPEDTVEKFIKDADLALYESKVQGRNCVTVYKPTLEETKKKAA